MPTETYISLQEAASLLAVTPATLRNWDKKGRLQAIRNPVNQYRMYRMSDVLAIQQQVSLFPVPADEEVQARSTPAPLTSGELRRLVRAVHRILRDCDGNSSLIERFDELTKILYCKIHDERSAGTGPAGRAFSVGGSEADAQVALRFRAAFRELVEREPRLFPARFAKLNLSDHTIAEVVRALAPVSLAVAADDLKGIAYEEMIKNTFDKGDNQQFFTPRPIVEFIVSMAASALKGRVCDPACGTGGFLLYTDRFVRDHRLRPVQLLGLEVDERLAWAAGINLDMHSVESFSVLHVPGAGSLGSAVDEYLGTIDAIITNPPFGSDLTDKDALAGLQLGRGRTSRRRGVLFIERCLALLKSGGLLAIIIDDSVLNGTSNTDTRELICAQSEVIGVVSLPETAFMPYASVKSSILFLKKRGGRGVHHHGGQTFFAEAEVVGRKPNGDPLFTLNKATSKMELDSDLPGILEQWRRTPRSSAGRCFWSQIPGTDDASFATDGFRLDPAYHHPSRVQAAIALQSARYPLRAVYELCEPRNESLVPSKDLRDEEITYVGLANIEAHSGVCAPTTINCASLKSAVKRFLSGDILFAKMRPELRKVCLIPEEIDEGFASAECLVLVPRRDQRGNPLMLAELLALLLRSDLVYGQLVHLVTGIGRPRLSPSAVQNVRLPVPPVAEQRRLLELFHRSEAAADTLMAQSQRSLAEAREIIADAGRQLVQDILIRSAHE